MSSQVSTSIIITSYNQSRTLRFLLCSLDRQTVRDFEVIVADDGSKDETAALCQEKRTFPLTWVTQEDLGYRKAKILNQALRQAQGEYLLFLDADVIVEKHFVEDHLSLRKPDHFVCGRRVDLGPNVSRQIVLSQVAQGKFDQLSLELLWSGLQNDSLGVKRALRLRSDWMRRALGYHRPIDLLGSNFSAWKEDILQVNGFNEALESYWGEDGDLYIRLRNQGKKAINAKGLCVQYHVYHPRRPVSLENEKRYQLLLQDASYRWAQDGLMKA
ncbi:MAG: glycosyltransferase [Bdellovibrionia bacterium]